MEDYPQYPTYENSLITVSAGDTVFVYADYNPANFNTMFFLENETTGTATAFFTERTINWDPTSAECIAEHPWLGKYGTPNFGSATFSGCVVG